MKNSNPIKITYHQFGSPSEVLQVESLDLVKPGPRQVAIRLLASPIDPVDDIIISGGYPPMNQLPRTPGVEGVGEIYAVGDLIDKALIKKRVIMPKMSAWQESVLANPDELLYVPNDVPIDLAAMAFINPPTAWFLLHDFVTLEPGDWIVQNAANSSVGTCIIQLAKHYGFKTINVVRDVALWEKPLKEMGADEVVQQDSEWFKDQKYSKKAKLALNAVGGHTIDEMLEALASGGIHVSYGSLITEPIMFPIGQLMSRDIALKGFSLFSKMKTNIFKEVLNSLFDFMRKGIIVIPVERKYALSDVKEAIKHEEEFHRKGKVLLISNWNPSADSY